jgi:hypothetical protein
MKRISMKLVELDLPPALFSLIVYLKTLAPGVYGFDSAELATGAATLGIVHATGYPLYLLLGKLFTFIPLNSIAYRVNLLSAVMGALTIWLIARLARRMTGSRWAAWVSAAVLAFSHSFWGMAVVAEVYTLHTFFAALTFLLLYRWTETRQDHWLYLFVFTYGLGLTNHVSGILIAPAYAWVILRTVSWRALLTRLPLLALLFLVGLAPYIYLPLRYASNPPLNYVADYYEVDLTTFKGMWWMVSGAAYRFFAFGYDLRGYVQELGQFGFDLWRNFTGLGVGLGVIGLVRILRKQAKLGVMTMLAFLAVTLFYAGYAVADKGTMFLPAYLVWGIWMSFGVWELEQQIQARIQTVPMHYAVRVSAALAAALICAFNWQWIDKSNEFGPEIFARQVFRTVDEEAVVMGPWSSAVILEYYKLVEGIRPDVEVFNRSRFEVAEYHKLWAADFNHEQAVQLILQKENDIVEVAMMNGPVYDLEYDPNLARNYVYQPIGRVFQLAERD